MIWRHRDGRHAVEAPETAIGRAALVALTHTGARVLDVQEAERKRDWRAYEGDEVRAAFIIAGAARHVGATPEAWEALSMIVELPEAWKLEALRLGAIRKEKEDKAAKKATRKPRKKKAAKVAVEAEHGEEDRSAGVPGGEW